MSAKAFFESLGIHVSKYKIIAYINGNYEATVSARTSNPLAWGPYDKTINKDSIGFV